MNASFELVLSMFDDFKINSFEEDEPFLYVSYRNIIVQLSPHRQNYVLVGYKSYGLRHRRE